MSKHEFKSINVTIPYKKDVIPYLDELDENAKAIGAVNTIVNKNGKLYGHNTDFSGFMYMLKKHNIKIEGKKCVVLGDGGASKAVVAVLKKNGSKRGYHRRYYKDRFSNYLRMNVLQNTQMQNL